MICSREGCNNPGKRRRQNTAYADDKENWAVFCDECQKEADEHWKERWEEYNQGVM